MGEVTVMDVDVDVDGVARNGETRASDQKKTLKRKRGGARASSDPLLNLDTEGKLAKIESLREELKSLFNFYKELNGKRTHENVGNDSRNNVDRTIAVLMEESGLPLSKLVAEIFEKLKVKIGNGNGDGDGGGVTSLISVQNRVLSIGQRVSYGISDADADILEDDSESALWCWETKDMKWAPKSMRAVLKSHRTIRKKIQERVTAISAMIAALEKSQNQQNHQELTRASEKLGKILNETDIRALVDNMEHNFGAEMTNEAKQEEKLFIKQLEKNKREEEKEKRRMERELQKEKLQNEKERKRLQDEAEKEERRREKEESEMKKLLKRQHEELEKDQRRREKEEAEMKRQLSLQKQATIMERFLKGGKTNSSTKSNQTPVKATSESPTQRNKELLESVTLAMDSVFSTSDRPKEEDIWKLHLNSWHHLGCSIRSSRHIHWGIRQKPKTELVKELKLSAIRGLAHEDEVNIENLVDEWVGPSTDGRLLPTNTDNTIPNSQIYMHRKKLLQFDKSHRPAYYGVRLKKSRVVSGRRPFVKDPELDYEIDSDEEWEEEEPGESLSDCDKDYKDGEESLDEGCSRGDDDDDSEDGFLVPDGYLSENEGIEVNRVDVPPLVEETSLKEAMPSEAVNLLYRRQKCLHNLTEHALRKNQPLIIVNFMHEKAPLLAADNVSGAEKHEQMCLQALSICAFPDVPSVPISIPDDREEGESACTSNGKASSTTSASAPTISDSDLSQIVPVIQSCPHGINKVVELLHEKFPAFSKSQLRNKVREISDFIDSRWQVKKDVLMKLGLTISPEKGSGRTKSIATFFSKRCLPPTDKSVNPNETSPQMSQKPAASTQPLQSPPAQEH